LEISRYTAPFYTIPSGQALGFHATRCTETATNEQFPIVFNHIEHGGN